MHQRAFTVTGSRIKPVKQLDPAQRPGRSWMELKMERDRERERRRVRKRITQRKRKVLNVTILHVI